MSEPAAAHSPTDPTTPDARTPCPGCHAAEARALVLQDPAQYVECAVCHHPHAPACPGCRDAEDYLRRTLAAAPARGPRGRAGALTSVVCDLCARPVVLDEEGARRTVAVQQGRARAAAARLRREAVVRAMEHLARWEPELGLRAVEPVRLSSGNVGGGAKITATDRNDTLDAGSDANALRRAFAIRDRLEALAARGRAETRALGLCWTLRAATVLAAVWADRPGGVAARAGRATLTRKLMRLRGDALFAEEVARLDGELAGRSAGDARAELGWALGWIAAHADALRDAIGPYPPTAPADRAVAVLAFMVRRRLRKGETWAVVLGRAFVDDATRARLEPAPLPVSGSSAHERAVRDAQRERGAEALKRHGQDLLDLAVAAWFGGIE